MPMAPPISGNRNGHIIALEGPEDIVSTQLRLLPTSPHILTLPSLQHYIKDPNPTPGKPFDPRELIRTYHAAAQSRHAEALDFLRPSSTPSSTKRLVFMHGGTVAAQAACLGTIMEHEPDWNIEVADATYCRLVSKGVVGLSTIRPPPHGARASAPGYTTRGQDEPKPEPAPTGGMKDGQKGVWERCMSPGSEDDTMGARIMRAMRAADVLDKETEFLQPDNDDVDLTVKLIDIPSRSGKRLSSSASDAQAPYDTPPDSPRTASNGGSAAKPTSRKPALRIRIPSPPIPWAGDVAVSANRRISSLPNPPYPPRDSSLPKRPRTAESELSPRTKPTSGDSPQEEIFGMYGLSLHNKPQPREQNEGRNPTNPAPHSVRKAKEEPFEEVLPLLEDLVLHFSTETPNELENFIFRRLSTGFPHGLGSTSDTLPAANPERLRLRKAHDDDGNVGPWVQNGLVHGLPTPGHSPTRLDSAVEDMRLYSLSVDRETAVSIQNCLRSFLADEFPLDDQANPTRNSVGSQEEAGVWKPLESDAGWMASPDGGRRLDLILAVGSESRVQKTRLSEVVGQLEKLGETSGQSRSGRLDLRYLIANAMQAFTAQPLTKQMQSNPFADRALLAALIIPHIETYMISHPDVRFLLIEYPAEHLATVLALQTLIGTEMMKVVGIINGDGSSLTRRPSATPSNPDAADPPTDRRASEGFRTLNRRGSHMSLLGSCAFSKANFLLASQASGFETAAFVAAIRESLISISDFYIPDRPLYKQQPPTPPPRRRPGNPTLDINFKPQQDTSSRAATSMLLLTPPSSPTSSQRHPSSSSPGTNHSSSITSTTTATTNTTASRMSDMLSSSAHKERINWAPVNYGTPSKNGNKNRNRNADVDEDDEDENQDDEERRLMPMYLRRREDKGNGQKALKWLGLV